MTKIKTLQGLNTIATMVVGIASKSKANAETKPHPSP